MRLTSLIFLFTCVTLLFDLVPADLILSLSLPLLSVSIYNLYAKRYLLHPFQLISISFVLISFFLGFVASPLVNHIYTDNPRLDNQVFDASQLSSYGHITILATIALTAYLGGTFLLAPQKYGLNLQIGKSLNKLVLLASCSYQVSSAVLVSMLILILSKAYLTLNGCMGSMSSFASSTCIDRLVLPINLFYGPILTLVVLLFLAAHRPVLRRISLLLLLGSLSLSFIAGDRRDILLPLSITILFLIANRRIRIRNMLTIFLFFYLFLLFSAPLMDSLTVNAGTYDYFSLASLSVIKLTSDPTPYLIRPFYEICSIFDISFIVDAAFRARSALTPETCWPLLSSFVSIVYRILNLEYLHACNAEATLFQYSLFQVDSAPYLINPSIAENYFYGGHDLVAVDFFVRGLLSSFVIRLMTNSNSTFMLFIGLQILLEVSLYGNSWNTTLFNLVITLFASVVVYLMLHVFRFLVKLQVTSL